MRASQPIHCRERPTASTNRRLLIATTNEGKLVELAHLLADLTWELIAPAQLGLALHVEEQGTTFVENARLKASAYFEATGVATLAEDSGLEIDALGGQPGVHSARYHGLPDGPAKNAHILDLLDGVPPAARRCRYVCAMVLIEADGRQSVFEGRCAGQIALAPAGTGGFGFDPIVLIPRLGRTMAELSEAEKNRVSHRGRAARKLLRHLARL